MLKIVLSALALLVAGATLLAQPAGAQQVFPTPEAASTALVDAAKTDGLDARPDIVERVLGALFGRRADPWQRIIPTTKAEDEDEEVVL